jgi:hypothetical protein
MIPIHADDLSVMSNSETFSCSGQNVKVSDFVGAVLLKRLGLTLVSRKTIRLLVAVLGLILTASHSQAGLGWTLAQFEQQYGKPVLDQGQIAGRTGYVFTGEDYIIAAFFRDTQVSRVLYICRGSNVLDWGKASALLKANAPDATWGDASKNEVDNFYRVNGTEDGVESYYASLTDDGKILAIWTKEDDDAGRTKPNPDTPTVSKVVGANEKSTGEGTSGQLPSSDSELNPGIEDSDGPANATSSSPARRPNSTHASRTKITKVKLRSTTSHREISHAANFDPKPRSTVSSHQHVAGHPPEPHAAPTPLLMNAGTGLYNSDYTQPLKNPKVPGP